MEPRGGLHQRVRRLSRAAERATPRPTTNRRCISTIPYPDATRDLNRWLPLVKWILAIPHYIVLAFLAIAAVVCVIIAWFAILFTGRYPRSLFEFVVGVFRWCLRVSAYAFLLTTDRYPPFSLCQQQAPPPSVPSTRPSPRPDQPGQQRPRPACPGAPASAPPGQPLIRRPCRACAGRATAASAAATEGGQEQAEDRGHGHQADREAHIAGSNSSGERPKARHGGALSPVAGAGGH